MKRKLSTLSIGLLLYALGIHQLVYLYEWMQMLIKVVIVLTAFLVRKQWSVPASSSFIHANTPQS